MSIYKRATVVYYMGMLHMHKDICLTNITGYDWLKFVSNLYPQNETLNATVNNESKRHAVTHDCILVSLCFRRVI